MLEHIRTENSRHLIRQPMLGCRRAFAGLGDPAHRLEQLASGIGDSMVRDALSPPRYCRFARARVVFRSAWEATTFTGHVRDGVAGGRRRYSRVCRCLSAAVRGTRTDITVIGHN